MKIFFWIIWCIILVTELFLLQGLLGMLFHKYNPVNTSSALTIALFLVLGAGLLAGSYYFYHVHRMKWACIVAGLPLMAIVLYFFVFLFLPLLLGERMN